MTTELTNAAQQALERLKLHQGSAYCNACEPEDEEAITALERALAQRPAAQEVDWRTPTTYAQRFTDAVALLCREAPPTDMVAGWLDLRGIGADDHRLQDWACERAPAWAQGIGLLDAAHVMASQPTEGVDHEAAPQQATPEPVGEPDAWQERQKEYVSGAFGRWYNCTGPSPRAAMEDGHLSLTTGGITYQWRPLYTRPAAAPAGMALVPVEPTEEQWGGLARDMMLAFDMNAKSPALLLSTLRNLGHDIPQWMLDEVKDEGSTHVLSKGTRAVLVYRAMLAAAQAKGGE